MTDTTEAGAGLTAEEVDALLGGIRRYDTPIYDDIGMQESEDGEWVKVEDLVGLRASSIRHSAGEVEADDADIAAAFYPNRSTLYSTFTPTPVAPTEPANVIRTRSSSAGEPVATDEAVERKAFEAWAASEWTALPPVHAWTGWKARAALHPAPPSGAMETAETPQVEREISTELDRLPCPACAAQNVFLTHTSRNLDARRHVECRICSVRGPVKTSDADAVASWNALPRGAMETAVRAEAVGLTTELRSMAQRIDNDGTPSQIVSADELRDFAGRLTAALGTKTAEPAVPVSEGDRVDPITGKMWSAGRFEFAKYAERFRAAQTSDEAGAVADIAPAEIFGAMREAELLEGLALLAAAQARAPEVQS